jgi:hypothetical protein
MARTAALKPEQLPADSKPTLDAFTKTIGFTPMTTLTNQFVFRSLKRALDPSISWPCLDGLWLSSFFGSVE